jgi:hypothetical protein
MTKSYAAASCFDHPLSLDSASRTNFVEVDDLLRSD